MLPLAMLVIGLHAALLTIPVRSVGSGGATSVAHALSVRMLSSPVIGADEPLAVPQAPVMAGPAVPQPAPIPTIREPAAVPAHVDPLPVLGTRSHVSPPLPTFGIVVPGIDSDANYFPRSMLSLAPRPLDAVVVDYPPIPNDIGYHVSELTLFIDETGRVARMRVKGDVLPPALEAAARAAFLGARFRPGEAAGQPVKSQIRVEVVFDSRPIAKVPS